MTQRCSKRIARRSDERGFTLIELLVVIIILGILAAVVVFAVRGTGDKGATAAMATDAKTLRTAEEAYFSRPGVSPGTQSYGTETQLASAGLLSGESSKHDIILIGSGPSSSFRIVCFSDEPGCGSGGDLPISRNPATNPQIMKVAGGSDVSGTNFLVPAATTSGTAHPNTEYMFNGLLRWADNNTAAPDLAQSFTISADQKTALFELRSGLKWQDSTSANPGDNQTVTAEDVEFSFDVMMRKHGRTQGSMGKALGATGSGVNTVLPANAITLPDGPTGLKVQFNFIQPYAPLLRQMNVTEAPIIPKFVYSACDFTQSDAVVATCGPNNPPSGADLIAANTSRPIGTGPFMLKSRNTTTQTLVLVKNPTYHQPGLPLVDEVQQFPYADQSLAADGLLAKAVDVALVRGDRVRPTPAADIVEPSFLTGDVPRGTGGGNCLLTWGFNLWQNGKTPAQIQAAIAANPATKGDHPIFSDQTLVDPDGPAGPLGTMARGLVVRKAISMGINRTALFNNIEFGKGRVADSPYHSKLTGAYAAQSLPPFDTATADLWLDNAGWSDAGSVRTSSGAAGMPPAGTQLTFTMHGISTNTQGVYFTQISQQLALAPVKVSVTSVQTAAGPGPTFATRPWDSTLFSVCQGDDPVIGNRRTMHSDQISNTAFTNMSGYYNPTVDNLWNTAFGSNYTPNHGQIQAIVANDAPMVWISETQNTRAWKNGCGGFNNQNTGLYAEAAACA